MQAIPGRPRSRVQQPRGDVPNRWYGKRGQVSLKGPPPEGRVAQKLSIQFPPGHTGQRLVCGLSIDVEDGAGSVLKIIDPKPREPFVLSGAQMNLAQDAANRGVMARALRMAGFEVTAESVAAPFGSRPEDKPARSIKAESARKRASDDRDKRSREEIGGVVSAGQVLDGDFRGRETVVLLPREVAVGGQAVKRVVIRQGVNREALEELEQQPSVAGLADKNGDVKWTGRIGKTVVEGQGRAATMRIGSVFRLDLELVA